MVRQTRSALDEAISAAVRNALEEHLPPILEQCFRAPSPTQPSGTEHFVSMAKMCRMLGLNRTTVLRRERQGKIPRRLAFPDGRSGWTRTQIDAWFATATPHTPDAEAAARLVARLGQ